MDLAGILVGDFGGDQRGDIRLRPGIIETDGVGPLLGVHVVDAARIVIRVRVRSVAVTGRADIDPTRRQLDGLIDDFQKLENSGRGTIDDVFELVAISGAASRSVFLLIFVVRVTTLIGSAANGSSDPAWRKLDLRSQGLSILMPGNPSNTADAVVEMKGGKEKMTRFFSSLAIKK